MSKVIELDDYEINSNISDIDLEYYAIFFFYMIEWTYSRKLLSEELENEESFINDIKRVRAKEIDCFDFLSKQLDFKLCTSFFKNDIIIDFVKLYISVNYNTHITKHIWGNGELAIYRELITNTYKPEESKALMEEMDSEFKLILEINYPDKVGDYFPLKYKR